MLFLYVSKVLRTEEADSQLYIQNIRHLFRHVNYYYTTSTLVRYEKNYTGENELYRYNYDNEQADHSFEDLELYKFLGEVLGKKNHLNFHNDMVEILKTWHDERPF